MLAHYEKALPASPDPVTCLGAGKIIPFRKLWQLQSGQADGAQELCIGDQVSNEDYNRMTAETRADGLARKKKMQKTE